MKKIIEKAASIAFILLLAVFSSCTSNDCEYIAIIDPCGTSNVLNISTGIDESGNVITPGIDKVDPYWRLINRPFFKQTTVSISDQQSINTINGNAFVVNYNGGIGTDWINQNNSSSISFINSGNTNQEFTARTIRNSNGETLPFIFERSFCLNSEQSLIIDLKARANIAITFILVNNLTNVIYSSSQNIESFLASWNETLVLPAGSYSIRGLLQYKTQTIPAFSVEGTIKTVDNSFVLTNNNKCCSNNVVALNIINDGDCNGNYDENFDGFFNGLITANLVTKVNSQIVTRTENVDAYGNIIFAGLPDGTYTIALSTFSMSPTSLISPNNFQLTVVNNEVKNFTIFVCP